jgi:hypothetical protein
VNFYDRFPRGQFSAKVSKQTGIFYECFKTLENVLKPQKLTEISLYYRKGFWHCREIFHVFHGDESELSPLNLAGHRSMLLSLPPHSRLKWHFS